MRESAGVLTSLVLFVITAACGGDGAPAAPDGSVAPELDAAVPPDAAVPDAGPPPPVVIRVVGNDGLPAIGARVVFHTDSGVLSHAVVGASGDVEADVPPGAGVTIARSLLGSDATPYELITYLNIEPGDALTVGQVEDGIEVTRALVTLPAFAGAAFYLADFGCNSDDVRDGARTFFIYNECLDEAGTFDMLATAYNSASEVIAFASITDIAPTGDNTNVDVTEWNTDLDPVAITFSGVAPGANLETELVMVRKGQPYSLETARTIIPTGGQSLAGNVKPDFAPVVEARALLYAGPLASDGAHVLRHRAAPTATTTLDLPSFFLPTVSDPVISTPSASDRPAMSWTHAGDMSEADGAIGLMSYFDPSLSVSVQWTVVAPVGTGFELPPLGEALADVLPTAEASFAPPTILFVAGDFLANYRDLRHSATGLLREVPVMPDAPSTLVVSGAGSLFD